MISSEDLFRQSTSKLEKLYGKEEAQSLSFLLFEHLFSLNRVQILSGKLLSPDHRIVALHDFINRLNQSEPIQYILGETEFYGFKFKVTPAVLIPRPETEELVRLIVDENKQLKEFSILDIGTGSGCIPISIKKELPNTTVYALDKSIDALTIAKENAENNSVTINFIEADILAGSVTLPSVDVIVSNPPYVTNAEKKIMQRNVLEHEPHMALFVADEDPLIFYKAIAEKAKNHLRSGGRIYFEINEQFGPATCELLSSAGFSKVKLLKDLSGKDRMVRGEKIN